MKYLYTLLLFLSFLEVAAQGVKPDFILEGMPFTSINSNEFGTVYEKYLSQNTSLGMSGGLGILISSGGFSRFTTAAGLRYNAQTLLADAKEVSQPIDYTNLDLYWKFMYGLQGKITPQSHLVFNIGMLLFFSLKNKSPQKVFLTIPYTDPLSGEQVNYLSGIYEKNGNDNTSGSRRNSGLRMLNIVMSMGYETTGLLPGHRRCGVLLEFSTRLTASNNTGVFYKFDRQRNFTGSSKFTDNRTSLGLNFYVALF